MQALKEIMLTLKGTIEMEACAFGPNGNFINDQAFYYLKQNSLVSIAP